MAQQKKGSPSEEGQEGLEFGVIGLKLRLTALTECVETVINVIIPLLPATDGPEQGQQTWAVAHGPGGDVPVVIAQHPLRGLVCGADGLED